MNLQLVEITDAGYAHPAVNALRQKHSRMQREAAKAMHLAMQDAVAHTAASAEDQWRRRSVQASANFFLEAGGSSAKITMQALASVSKNDEFCV